MTTPPMSAHEAPHALDLSPRMADPDGFYEALIEAHRDLDDGASARLNARLILILANQIGDMAVLRAALAKARDPR